MRLLLLVLMFAAPISRGDDSSPSSGTATEEHHHWNPFRKFKAYYERKKAEREARKNHQNNGE